MKVAIFSGGEFTAVKILPYDKLICADKGYLYAKNLGINPDYIVGDFDSLGFIPQGAEVFPCEKDCSDTELATKKAISLGATEIDYYFCLGGRLDHQLFNINLLKFCKNNGVSAKIIDSAQTIYYVSEDKNTEFAGKVNCFISIIPTTEKIVFNSSRGLKYPLDNLETEIGATLTLSNVLVSDKFSIKIDKGEALVIVNG